MSSVLLKLLCIVFYGRDLAIHPATSCSLEKPPHTLYHCGESLSCLTVISFLREVMWSLRRRISLIDLKVKKSFLFMSIVFHWLMWLREGCTEVLQLGASSDTFPNNRVVLWAYQSMVNFYFWQQQAVKSGLLWPFFIPGPIFFHCAKAF